MSISCQHSTSAQCPPTSLSPFSVKHLCMIQLSKPQHVQHITLPGSFPTGLCLPSPTIRACQIRCNGLRIGNQISPGEHHGGVTVLEVLFPQDIVRPKEAPSQCMRDSDIFGAKIRDYIFFGSRRLTVGLECQGR